ncbi:MAG: Uma2 family endonuclease [Planctomycetia bacterium]|nr:Uma2 family endonuclease [Planctomycetia bacterium]
MSPTPTTTGAPPKRHYLAQSSFRKFTLDEYHKMIETGVLTSGEPYELLEGNLVHKLSSGIPHDKAIQALTKRLVRLLPTGWDVRAQCAVTLAGGSEPEPDFALVRGDESTYANRHPGPADTGLLIEVSDTSLSIDRHDKGSIYAANGIPIYWVVNVVDKVIEVYTQPTGTGDSAAYSKRDDFALGTSVPAVLDGNTIGTIPVADVVG